MASLYPFLPLAFCASARRSSAIVIVVRICRSCHGLVQMSTTSAYRRRPSRGVVNSRRLAPLAQLDRAADFGSAGWGFESLRARHVLFWLLAAVSAALRAVAFFRYRFDSDEPQHLHVAWGWATGLLPYRDFFDNHAPLFHIATAPILRAVGEREDVLLFMRAPILVLFAVMIWATWVLGKRLYDAEVGRWAAVMLSLLPPFFLKSLEYRTDNLWVALWMIAVVVLTGGELTIPRGFIAGVILGFAMATSMKTSLLLITLGI